MKYLSGFWLYLIAWTSLWALPAPVVSLKLYTQDAKGNLQQARAGETLKVNVGEKVFVRATYALAPGDQWYSASCYLYAFYNMPNCTREDAKNLLNLPNQPDPKKPQGVFYINSSKGYYLDPSSNKNDLTKNRIWVHSEMYNFVLPKIVGTYYVMAWCRSQFGAPSPTGWGGTKPVKISFEVLDKLNIAAKAVPASEGAKVWFESSPTHNVSLQIGP